MNIDYAKIKTEAVGRWHGIMNALAIEVGDGKHCPCPMCGGRDRFRFDDKDGNGTWFCNNCGAGDGWSLVQKVLNIDFTGAVKEVSGVLGVAEKRNTPNEKKFLTPEQMRTIFTSSSPIIVGDPAWRYLEGRGLKYFPNTIRYHPIRYHPACWEPETKLNQKAMLTVFHNKHGQAITIHRTYIDDDGNKLPIESPKKILPPIQNEVSGAVMKMQGGAARLYELKGDVLGIAEGVETAIAAALDMSIPVWAALTSTLLETFVPPVKVRKLIIIGDNDLNFTGQKAAYTLANRAELTHKTRASVYIPVKPGTDWLDVYNSKVKK